MAYDRYENRRGWREPRSRSSHDHSDRLENRGQGRSWDRDDDDDRDRGFFERAGDQIASWLGDDDPDRRRRESGRSDEGGWRGEDSNWRRQGSSMSDEDFGRYDRQPPFRDEGPRRPYTGRSFGRQQQDRGSEGRYRPMAGDYGRSSDQDWDEGRRGNFSGMASTAGSLHDPHYSEWRRRQLDELDRDYDDYRRENQSRFESDFSNWRTQRQSKRQLLGQVREHMTVVGSDEEQIGTVDCVRGDRIVLTKGDSDDSRHHAITCSMVDRVEGDRVILDQPAEQAKQRFETGNRDRGFFRDEDEREDGHMLNRAFSGTYER